MRIRIGHSPDPDDAFMFYGFASGRVTIPGCAIEHVLHDIQTLNELAHGDDALEVTALSLHAWFALEEKFALLEVGSSVGRKYGPRVVATEPRTMEELGGCRIAVPGPNTTAALVAEMLLPEFEAVQYEFTEIMRAVLDKEVDAGILIHEGQLTFAEQGLQLIADLGEEFARQHDDLPLPLGVNCVRRDLPDVLKREIAEAYRKSVNIAMTQREDAVKYSLQYGRGLGHSLADTFVGMYVNEDSLSFSDDVRKAIDILREFKQSRMAAKAVAAT